MSTCSDFKIFGELIDQLVIKLTISFSCLNKEHFFSTCNETESHFQKRPRFFCSCILLHHLETPRVKMLVEHNTGQIISVTSTIYTKETFNTGLNHTFDALWNAWWTHLEYHILGKRLALVLYQVDYYGQQLQIDNKEGNATFTSIKRHHSNFKHEFIYKHILREWTYTQGVMWKWKQ